MSANNFKTALSGIHPCNHILATTTLVPTVPSSPHQSNCDNVFACMTHCTTHSQETICDNMFACMTRCTTHPQGTICGNVFACMTHCMTHSQGTKCGNMFACMAHCMTHPQGTICDNVFACMTHCMTHSQGTKCGNVFACTTHSHRELLELLQAQQQLPEQADTQKLGALRAVLPYDASEGVLEPCVRERGGVEARFSFQIGGKEVQESGERDEGDQASERPTSFSSGRSNVCDALNN